MMVVCNWGPADARKRDALDRARVHGEEPPAEILAEERGLHSSIEADVKSLLEGKNSNKLESMKQQIESQMRSGTAKARLKEIHASLLRKDLERLDQPVETVKGLETDTEVKTEEEELMHNVEDDQQYFPELLRDEPRDKPREEPEAEEEEPGSFSPQLLYADEDDEAIDPEVDQAELYRKREAIVAEHQRRIWEAMSAKKAATPDELEMKAIKARGLWMKVMLYFVLVLK